MVELKAGGAVVGAAEGDGVVAEFAQGFETRLAVGVVLNEFADGHEVADEGPSGDLIGNGGVGGDGEGANFGGHMFIFTAEAPVPVAIFAPLGKVLFYDGFAVKFGGEHGLHLWKGIKPGQQDGSPLAIFGATVDFVAEFFGQSPNFAFMMRFHSF